MKEHQAELSELRKAAGEGRGVGGKRPNKGQPQGENPPPPMDDNAQPRDEKDMASARERLQSIMQGAPKIEDLYTKIWTELTPDQKKAVDGRLDEFRARQAKEREDRYVEQRLNKKKGQPNAPKADGPKPPQPPGDQPNPPRRPDGQNRPFDGPRPNADGPRGERDRAPIDPGRRDRLMRIFSRLSPEQQDQLLQRLEQRLRDERSGEGNTFAPQPNRRRPNAPQGPGERRPAPQPDDSMVPPHPPMPPQSPAPPQGPQQDEP